MILYLSAALLFQKGMVSKMSVNGITNDAASVQGSYVYTPANVPDTKSTVTDKTNEKVSAAATAASTGVVYERDTDTAAAKAAESTKKTYKQDPELISKIKAQSELHTQQLENIVNQLITGQGKSFSIATGTNLADFFKDLQVDEATRAKAAEDISEDGYYGVKQTSERIFDFAKALSGGDPEKMEEMRKAFEKGYKQATGAWGEDLPDISQKTYEAVQSLFDQYANEQEQAAQA